MRYAAYHLVRTARMLGDGHIGRMAVLPELRGLPGEQIRDRRLAGEQVTQTSWACDVAFVGDVVGTGSSRKSATNSVLWFFGDDIDGVPNKKGGGICIGGKVAPIFYNTMEDAGALVFEAPVDQLGMGDVIEIRPYDGKILSESGDILSEFALKSDVLLDEVRAGGRINLIIGRGLTTRAREALGLPESDLFRKPEQPADTGKGLGASHQTGWTALVTSLIQDIAKKRGSKS